MTVPYADGGRESCSTSSRRTVICPGQFPTGVGDFRFQSTELAGNVDQTTSQLRYLGLEHSRIRSRVQVRFVGTIRATAFVGHTILQMATIAPGGCTLDAITTARSRGGAPGTG